jgi:hypothetical protein
MSMGGRLLNYYGVKKGDHHVESTTTVRNIFSASTSRINFCDHHLFILEILIVALLDTEFTCYEDDIFPTSRSESNKRNLDPSFPPLVKSLSIIATK